MPFPSISTTLFSAGHSFTTALQDFTGPDRKQKTSSSNPLPAFATDDTSTPSTGSQVISGLTPKDVKDLYKKLHESGVKCAILALVPEYADNYIPKTVQLNMPKPLTKLLRPKYGKLSYIELIEECKNVFAELRIDHEQVGCSFGGHYA